MLQILVIVLLVIWHWHSPTPAGLMSLSFFFSGTHLHARSVDMWSCVTVSVASCLAQVATLSASFCEWVPHDVEQINSLQVSMSICVGPPDHNELFALDAISSWGMFSKMTFSVFVSRVEFMADCFISAAFGCFSSSFFMSAVMLCSPSMSRAVYCCDRKSPGSMCAKLHTVAASNNRDHVPQSLHYCLFVPCIYIVVLRTHPAHGESHIQRNATGEVVTTSPHFYIEPHWSHVLCVKAEPSTTFTSWSEHHFVAIGKARADVRKASHCGSNQQ